MTDRRYEDWYSFRNALNANGLAIGAPDGQVYQSLQIERSDRRRRLLSHHVGHVIHRDGGRDERQLIARNSGYKKVGRTVG